MIGWVRYTSRWVNNTLTNVIQHTIKGVEEAITEILCNISVISIRQDKNYVCLLELTLCNFNEM